MEISIFRIFHFKIMPSDTHLVTGFAKRIFFSKNPRYFRVVYCVFCLYNYALLKVVGYYVLGVLSMSVMGFQKKVWMDGGWVG